MLQWWTLGHVAQDSWSVKKAHGDEGKGQDNKGKNTKNVTEIRAR